MNPMKLLDRIVGNYSRRVAQQSSRRSMLSKLGIALVGAAAVPTLPVLRGARAAGVEVPETTDDPLNCEYWRHCAIDGFLCGCCGGSHTSCPPGTEMSPITWIGTCENPADGKSYLISYNDCCGKSGCGRCFCHRNERDTPLFMPARANDINWCLGTTTIAYHCSLSVVLGLAADGESAG